MAPGPEHRSMKIKIRISLGAELVDEARRLGLDISRIVDESLIRETAAGLIRRQVNQAENCEDGDDPGR